VQNPKPAGQCADGAFGSRSAAPFVDTDLPEKSETTASYAPVQNDPTALKDGSADRPFAHAEPGADVETDARRAPYANQT
jgi:hypothetical protein